MNLAARRSARLKEKLVMRLGCLLVSFAVLASLILEPPRAKAFAVTSSAVTALAGAYLNACGLAPVVSGMSSSEEVNESLARLIQEYLDTDLPGTPLTDWLGNLSNLSLIHDRQWMLLLPTQAAASLHLFAAWVAGKYGTKAGINAVFSDQSITFPDSKTFTLTKIGERLQSGFTFDSIGTSIPYGTFESPYIIEVSDTITLKFYIQGSMLYAQGKRVMSFDGQYFNNFTNTSLIMYVCPPGIGYSDRVGCLAAGLVYYSDKYNRYVISINPTFPLLDAGEVGGLLSEAEQLRFRRDVSDAV